MPQSITVKYVLKIWITALFLGNLITFTLLSLFTNDAGEINTFIDLIRITLTVTFFAAILTLPAACVCYIFVALTLGNHKTTFTFKKNLFLMSGLLLFVFLICFFQEGILFLWTIGPTLFFFYSFLTGIFITILIIPVPQPTRQE